MEIYQVLFRRFPHFTTLNRLTVPVWFGFGHDFGLTFPSRLVVKK